MFEAAIAWLSTLLVFLVGLVARALLAVLIIAALVVPIALGFLAWTYIRRAVDRAEGLSTVGHVRWRRRTYYTPGHLWLRPRGADAVRIGLDDVAQRVLPEIAAVHLPMEGALLRKGEAIGQILCPEGSITLRAPMTGRVAAVNTRLQQDPSLLHADPYRRAWIVEMVPQTTDYRSLLTGEKARAWLLGEDQRLADFMATQLGVQAADGGELILPPHKLLSPAQWDAVRDGFLCQTSPEVFQTGTQLHE